MRVLTPDSIRVRGESRYFLFQVSTKGGTTSLGMGALANNYVWNHVNCDQGPECAGPPHPHWEIMLTAAGGLAGTAIGAGISTRGWHDVYRVGK
jgi:hypothetical protein